MLGTLPFVIGFLGAVWRFSFEKVITRTLLGYSMLLSFLGFGLFPYYESLQVDNLLEGPLGTLVRYWPVTLFAIIMQLAGPTMVVLFGWGVINQYSE